MLIEIGDNGLRTKYHWERLEISEEALSSHNPWLDESRPFTYYVQTTKDGKRISTRKPLADHSDISVRAALAAYLAVRIRCPFLTNLNHDWEVIEYETPSSPSLLKLFKYTCDSRYHLRILSKPDAPNPRGLDPKLSRYWFHFAYRIPNHDPKE